MKKRLGLCAEVFLDIGIGAVLGFLAILGTVAFGAVLVCILTVFFIGILIVCAIGFPILSLMIGLFLLIGYPISSGRIIKQKINEFKETLKGVPEETVSAEISHSRLDQN